MLRFVSGRHFLILIVVKSDWISANRLIIQLDIQQFSCNCPSFRADWFCQVAILHDFLFDVQNKQILPQMERSTCNLYFTFMQVPLCSPDMRKDQKCPWTSIDDDKMSTFSQGLWFMVWSQAAIIYRQLLGICGQIWFSS